MLEKSCQQIPYSLNAKKESFATQSLTDVKPMKLLVASKLMTTMAENKTISTFSQSYRPKADQKLHLFEIMGQQESNILNLFYTNVFLSHRYMVLFLWKFIDLPNDLPTKIRRFQVVFVNKFPAAKLWLPKHGRRSKMALQ